MPGQLYKLDSSYGSEQQLAELLAKLRDAGIDPLADIVINHRCVVLAFPLQQQQLEACTRRGPFQVYSHASQQCVGRVAR